MVRLAYTKMYATRGALVCARRSNFIASITKLLVVSGYQVQCPKSKVPSSMFAAWSSNL